MKRLVLAVKEATSGGLYKRSTASGWEKAAFCHCPLPSPRLPENLHYSVPGRRSPEPLAGCRGSVSSPWQPPPADIPVAHTGKGPLWCAS